ncbi:MAG: hypothetical protein HYX68_24505 [Planctomycetes bacterium]|nr:hypothetical protein [Planctomycetota bacterium]
MNNPSKVFFAMLIIAGVAVAAFFTIGPPAEKVYASPREVFDGAHKAKLKNDVRAWFQCLTDGSRDVLTATSIVYLVDLRQKLAGIGKADREADARDIDKLLAKHRLREDFLDRFKGKAEILVNPQATVEDRVEIARALLAPVSDRVGLAAETHKMLGQILPDFDINPYKGGKLIDDPKISGESAKGIVMMEKGAARPIAFRKQLDSWRIDLLATERTPQIPLDLK